MRRILFITFVMTFTFHLSATAQKIVTGKVIDESNEPLVGATVTDKSSNKSVITGADGTYKIQVKSDNTVLLFKFIGMEPYQASVKGVSRLDVTLKDGANQLAETVVVSTGYQKLSRERSTAAFGFVDSTKLTRVINKDLVSSLEGQVAGLVMDINPNTGEGSPVLRGIGTFSNSIGTMPLIVVDDMATNLTLSEINPYDVESVTVLKDAAAASIYGALAANGVIVVTTKQGKSDKVKVSMNADWFISSKPSLSGLHFASTSDIIDYETDVYRNRLANAGSVATLFDNYKDNYYSPLYQLYRDQAEGRITESEMNSTLAQWRQNDFYEQYRDLIWRTSLTQRYNLSLQQGGGGNNHYVSFSFEHDKNRIKSDRSNSFSVYYKSTFKIKKWLSVKVGVDARLGNGTSPNNSYTNYAMQNRYERIVDENGEKVISPYVNVGGYVGSAINGSRVNELKEYGSLLQPFGFNVLESINESMTESKTSRIRPFVNAEVSFLKSFKFNVMYQYEWGQTRSQSYDDPSTYQMRITRNAFVDVDGNQLLPEGGRYFQQTNNSYRYTFRSQLNFDKAFLDNKHNVNAIMGFELRENRTPRYIQQLMYGYNETALTSSRMDWQTLYNEGWESLVYNGSQRYGGLTTSQTETFHRYASFYANVGYNYKYRYNITGSIRWDEADLFGLDTREQKHPLWSVGAGWNVSEEKFMKPVSWVDYLKLRATYGVNGNVDQSSTTYFVARYRTLSQDPTSTPYLNYSDDNLPNPKLRWEKTSTFNAGIDFRLFNNILSGSLEYYNRVGSDLLVTKFLDPTLGASSRVINNGKMRNRGVELSLTGNILRKKDWNISANLNLSYNQNKMLKVEHSPTSITSNFITSPRNYFIEGTSYNTLWAYRLSRVQNGYPVILDANGNEMITFNEDGSVNKVNTTTMYGTDALVNMGSVTPKYNGSLSLNFRWKDLELNTMFVFAGGHKLRMEALDMNSYTLTTELINSRWSENAKEGVRVFSDIPNELQTYASTLAGWWRYADVHVKRADYLKMRNINLAYHLPEAVCKKLHVGDTRLTFQVNNLFYVCAAGNGIDPESYGFNTGSRNLSQPKTFSIGLSTSF